MIENILAGFQLLCRDKIINSINTSQKTAIVKSPTGSGKTVIMSSVIEKYLESHDDVVFVWLCPGSGDLEEQSKDKFEEKCPSLSSKTLNEALTSGFEAKDTIFINWEMVVNKKNKSIQDYERKNLFDRIADAHRKNLRFIIVVDEEQSNDTEKAQSIIDAFSAFKQIRMSATAKERANCEFIEIEEVSVIKSEYISKAIVINDGVQEKKITLSNEPEILIDLAVNKRKSIYNKYLEFGKKINPLIIIQFPSSSNNLISYVENFLSNYGITYSNGLLAKWMAESEDKINLKGENWSLTDANALPIVLLMKQAISTGWDCPRAKILVKLRENTSEDFEIQTLGRIRRMPERKHYDEELLDYCFLYTLDTDYVNDVKDSYKSLYEIKKVLLKEKCKDFSIDKELKPQNGASVSIREAYKSIINLYYAKYKLQSDLITNKGILSKAGYCVEDKIINYAKKGIFGTLDEIKSDTVKEITIKFDVDTSKFGLALMNAVYHIAQSTGINAEQMSTILKKLFRRDFITSDKRITSFNKKEYYAFIINNEDLLKKDFKEATNQVVKQFHFSFSPVIKQFTIPEVEYVKYDPFERANDVLESNAYYDYNEQTLVEGLRSKSERLFERYCESNKNVDWYYKNGDSGIQYFSILYKDSFGGIWSFYPDYIVKLNNGDIWIVETKGGELLNGKSKNIDIKVENKFESFKEYAKDKNIKWAFVRDLNDKLYFNNTVYVDSMMDSDKWKSIRDAF